MFVVFENNLKKTQLVFSKPQKIIICSSTRTLTAAWPKLEQALEQGYYLAGWLSYEAGLDCENLLERNFSSSFPLLSFGVFPPPQKSWHWPKEKVKPLLLSFSLTPKAYQQKIDKIKEALQRGELYQLNLTFKGFFNYAGDPAALYQHLRFKQPTAYSAYLASQHWRILSLSPELFFQKKGSTLILKPMKGTARVTQAKNFLRQDEKNRSENLMIVDLLRNDLGRIAYPGTIQVPQLFTVEKYPSLQQMTSTITGQIPPKIKFQTLFSALFPSGSVTGAPKISAMKLIQQLEESPRNIYTGAIGYITPQREMLFNVAIRTLLLKKEGKNYYRGEIGLGSGIVNDSDWRAEYHECLLKGKFLSG